MSRLGPQMMAALRYVSRNPGCPIMPVGEHLGFTRNRGYGYDPVHRCLRDGYLENKGSGRCRTYVLQLTEKGKAVL